MNLEGLFELQFMMFILMGVGFFLRKKNILTAEGKKMLTDLVIDVILPCNIITAFSIEFNQELLMAGLQVLLISLVLQLFCTLISAFCY